MNPVFSPNDHSPVKPSPGIHPSIQENKSNSDIDKVEDDNGANLNSMHNHFKRYGVDMLYKLYFMKMDGTMPNAHNMKIIFCPFR